MASTGISLISYSKKGPHDEVSIITGGAAPENVQIVGVENKGMDEVNHNEKRLLSDSDDPESNRDGGGRTNDSSQYDERYKMMPNHRMSPRKDSDMEVYLQSNGTVVSDVRKEKELDDEEFRGEERETWGKKIDFLLSIIGFAVDLANVWRFPYLCYRNGGGAFLIPYFLMLLFGALPLFYMEVCLGQFNREGPVTVWKVVPIFTGVGWAVCLIAYYVAFFYNVILAWSLYYLVGSFTSVLPWTTCGNDWNDCQCWDSSQNATDVITCNNVTLNVTTSQTSATQYFERGMLGIERSTGIDDLGEPRWQLVLCLLAVFLILYFALWKGVKTSGKVVWVTATLPYIILLILLIRGLLLPGSVEGITYFIVPKVERLADPQVWNDAAIQVFFSVGAGFGVHLAYASYNKFHNNCYRDCLITAGVNSFTSIFSGFVVFSYLGYMAFKKNTDIEKVAVDGPGLVFIVYPEAIATLPGSTGWSIIFFLMLMALGLDSAMGGMESVLTGVKDYYRHFFSKFKYGREFFTFVIIFFAFGIALINITYGGMYPFTLLEQFSAGTSLLFAVFTEAVAVAWFYGIDQFCKDVKKMLGFTPGIYWRICWKFISPIFVLVIVVSSIITYRPIVVETATHGPYPYPDWANAVGWCIAGSSMILVPVVAVWKMLVTKGTFKRRLALCISPESEHADIKAGKPVKRFTLRHWVSI
ncbi:sodium-dependent noradrenaline transporter isoform X1 [Lingula anatina]|uniref:Transporter n=2 Tax=Lingula anatina TaxID=7574 RepID=A0A1S3IWS7_LINAN|nr:sodium-dependent noradrenaline transporter isoform X1 [Lingula anatina]|eukprot:XP_013402004.1 sodium-dependent noradrenaline transporter isoform X1 [Lingula anatina]